MEPDATPARGPTRAQKRWSGRLRMAGALLALFGGVAVIDAVVGLASPSSPLSPVGRTRAPLAVGVIVGLIGGALYLLGRRWR